MRPNTFSDLDVPTNSMPATAVLSTAHTYSTSNTPPLTTHLALNVCEALRRQCPCDEYRDAKGRDCVFDLAFAASDQFSRKQLHRATTCFLRRQRPWTSALGGSYLPCLNCMLGCWGIEVVHIGVTKVAGGFPHPRGEVFTPWGGGVIPDISKRGR